jgi:hypothetical protein
LKRVVVVLAAVAALSLAAALPASANSKPVTGPRISFFAPPASFAADSPFYIEQGFGCLLTDRACMTSQITGQSGFQLYVDGVLQPSTPEVDVTDGVIRKFQLTNFPNGLPAGTHTFVGVFIVDGVANEMSMTIDFT